MFSIPNRSTQQRIRLQPVLADRPRLRTTALLARPAYLKKSPKTSGLFPPLRTTAYKPESAYKSIYSARHVASIHMCIFGKPRVALDLLEKFEIGVRGVVWGVFF